MANAAAVVKKVQEASSDAADKNVEQVSDWELLYAIHVAH